VTRSLFVGDRTGLVVEEENAVVVELEAALDANVDTVAVVADVLQVGEQSRCVEEWGQRYVVVWHVTITPARLMVYIWAEKIFKPTGFKLRIGEQYDEPNSTRQPVSTLQTTHTGNVPGTSGPSSLPGKHRSVDRNRVRGDRVMASHSPSHSGNPNEAYKSGKAGAEHPEVVSSHNFSDEEVMAWEIGRSHREEEQQSL